MTRWDVITTMGEQMKRLPEFGFKRYESGNIEYKDAWKNLIVHISSVDVIVKTGYLHVNYTFDHIVSIDVVRGKLQIVTTFILDEE